MTNFSGNSSAAVSNFTTVSSSKNARLLGWMIATLLTNGFGVFANVLLLLALLIYKPLRRSSSCALIVHCIAIDLYTTAVTIPLTTVTLYLGPTYNHYPRHYCRDQTLTVFISYGIATYAEMVLAINRLCAAILPKIFAIMTRKVTIVVMLVIPWIAGVVINIFPTFELGLKFTRSSQGGCGLVATNSGYQRPIFAYTAATTYGPTVVMGICYFIILVKTAFDLRRRRQSLALRRRLEITRTLFLSFIWYCVTQYPLLIIITFYVKAYSESPALQLGIKYLTNCFFATNPIFYFISSQLFQDGAKKVLRRRWLFRKVKPETGAAGTSVGGTESMHTDNADKKEGQVDSSKYTRGKPSQNQTSCYY